MTEIRVCLVDDQALFRAGIRMLIESQPDLSFAGEAADGAAGAALANRSRPDVILMDVRMPGVDGIRATREILARVPGPPKILVVTTFENDDYVYDALRAGADGFLLKRSRPEEILQAIRMVVQGDILLFPAAIRSLAAARVQSAPAGADWHGRLTEREAEVLRLMSSGLSNAEIADALVVSPQTVKTHVGNLLAKLGARDRTQAVIFAYESGFIQSR